MIDAKASGTTITWGVKTPAETPYEVFRSGEPYPISLLNWGDIPTTGAAIGAGAKMEDGLYDKAKDAYIKTVGYGLDTFWFKGGLKPGEETAATIVKGTEDTVKTVVDVVEDAGNKIINLLPDMPNIPNIPNPIEDIGEGIKDVWNFSKTITYLMVGLLFLIVLYKIKKG